jgi:hypothetical protein
MTARESSPSAGIGGNRSKEARMAGQAARHQHVSMRIAIASLAVSAVVIALVLAVPQLRQTAMSDNLVERLCVGVLDRVHNVTYADPKVYRAHLAEEERLWRPIATALLRNWMMECLLGATFVLWVIVGLAWTALPPERKRRSVTRWSQA